MTRRPYTPRLYQPLMVEHQVEHERGATWAGMGLGKTLGTLTAMEVRALIADPYPALVIAPMRVAQNTWSNEAAKWEHLSSVRVIPAVGDIETRKAALKRPGEVYTINYENLPWLVEHLGEAWRFRTVIADESTKIKSLRISEGKRKDGTTFTRSGGGSVRARAIGRIAHTKIKYWQNLTGTPSPNGLIDLWGQQWPIDAGQRLGRTFEGFTQRWFQKKPGEQRGIEPLPFAQDQIQAALRDVCLTIDAKDYFDLAEPIVTDVMVYLPARARALYEDMEKRMFLEIDENEVEAFSAAAKSMKCLQLANGAIYLDPAVESDEQAGAREWREVHDAKLQALDDIVEEAAGAPVLVAYHFKSDLIRLQAAFPHGIDISTLRGLQAAQRGEGRVWFAHPASLGHGIDGLQDHCNIIAFFGLNWNLENYLQIIERIGPVRQMQAGLERPVFIYRIVAHDTVDELVIERIASKRNVQDILLTAMKRRTA